MALTDKGLARSAFSCIPSRLSPRSSSGSSDTLSLPLTFDGSRPWEAFVADAGAYGHALNDQQLNHTPVDTTPMDAAAEVVDITSAQAYLFMKLNSLLQSIGIDFRYVSGGDRSLSQTHFVLLDRSTAASTEERPSVSSRVHAVGVAKGPWQWSGQDPLSDPSSVQEVFGAMVLDETRYGFLTNYNRTVFFRRSSCPRDKLLECSPVVDVEKWPLQFYAFVAAEAVKNAADKLGLHRYLVPSTCDTLRKHKRESSSAPRLDLEDLTSLPVYCMNELGLTGRVAGFAKYGCVLEGCIAQCQAVLKMYDLRNVRAVDAMQREAEAYAAMLRLQGSVVPAVLAIGRLPHSSFAYLALTDEGCQSVERMKRIVEQDKLHILQGLVEIHGCGVLHGAPRLTHIMKVGKHVFKFIDFDMSRVQVAKGSQDFREEYCLLEELLEDKLTESVSRYDSPSYSEISLSRFVPR